MKSMYSKYRYLYAAAKWLMSADQWMFRHYSRYPHCRPSDSLTPCSLVIPFHLLLLFIRRRCPQSSAHVSPHGAASSSFQTEMKCYSHPVTRSNHTNPRKQVLSVETVVTSNRLSNVSS